jgi:hypothetical protein
MDISPEKMFSILQEPVRLPSQASFSPFLSIAEHGKCGRATKAGQGQRVVRAVYGVFYHRYQGNEVVNRYDSHRFRHVELGSDSARGKTALAGASTMRYY